LDHAPAGKSRATSRAARSGVAFAEKQGRSISLRYHEADDGPTGQKVIYKDF